MPPTHSKVAATNSAKPNLTKQSESPEIPSRTEHYENRKKTEAGVGLGVPPSVLRYDCRISYPETIKQMRIMGPTSGPTLEPDTNIGSQKSPQTVEA